MDVIVAEIIERYELEESEVEEVTSLVDAYRSIDFTDEQIKDELRSFFIGL